MKATFGMGFFWCSEDVFQRIKGVKSTAVGYMGGWLENPTYEQVCMDKTGHAEVVQVEYELSMVSYDQLLDAFWSNHDPTTLNRQGPDIGMQYRSAVFFHTPEQEAEANAAREKLDRSGRFKKKIVTEITLAMPFWKAEEYHQKYYAKCGMRPHYRALTSNSTIIRLSDSFTLPLANIPSMAPSLPSRKSASTVTLVPAPSGASLTSTTVPFASPSRTSLLKSEFGSTV